jgi:hypothetical protein
LHKPHPPPARCLTLQEFGKFSQAVAYFALVGVPAAVVNSGLKFMQKNIELSFQQRLTLYLHKRYTSNRAYYAASTLNGLSHADQRITEDCERFSAAISELYSHTFKVRGHTRGEPGCGAQHLAPCCCHVACVKKAVMPVLRLCTAVLQL